MISARTFVLLGDFNVHSESPANLEAASLLADLSTLNLNRINNEPTHLAGHMLDLILTNSSDLTYGATCPLTWSDHSMIEFHISGPK